MSGPFDFILPAIGGIAGGFVGGPIGAAVGSGLGSFVATGDVGKGIMSGIMGYGLGSAGELLGGLGGGAAGASANAASNAATAAAAAPQVGASSVEGIIGSNSMPWVQGDLISPGQISALNAAKPSSFGGFDLSGDSLKRTFLDNATKTTLPIGMGLMGLMGDMGGQGQQPAVPPVYNGRPIDINARTNRHYRGPGTPSRQGYEQTYFDYAGGGAVAGPGSGLDDAIPAIVNGRQPAALSDGEYVVPAHAVSALGNGSTNAGVRQLDGMVDNVMTHKFGTRNRKPKPLNPARVMPGGQGARPFADGGLVGMLDGRGTMADYLQAYAMLGSGRSRRQSYQPQMPSGPEEMPEMPSQRSTPRGVDYGGDDGGGDLATDRERISRLESGGNYRALGPNTGGDRAYGRYQVMGANIPSWSQDALGRSLTPDEFLADDKAQDAVFNHRFGGYRKKYGSAGAARAWFAGEGGMNNRGAKDVLGTSVDDYERKFGG